MSMQFQTNDRYAKSHSFKSQVEHKSVIRVNKHGVREKQVLQKKISHLVADSENTISRYQMFFLLVFQNDNDGDITVKFEFAVKTTHCN